MKAVNLLYFEWIQVSKVVWWKGLTSPLPFPPYHGSNPTKDNSPWQRPAFQCVKEVLLFHCLTPAFNIRCSCLKALSYLSFGLVSETVDWIEPPEKANRPVHQQLLRFPLTAPTAPRFVSPLASASTPLISMYVVREERICMVNGIHSLRSGKSSRPNQSALRRPGQLSQSPGP